MTEAGKRFDNWLIKNKGIRSIVQYLAMPLDKRIELRQEWQVSEEGVKRDD